MQTAIDAGFRDEIRERIVSLLVGFAKSDPRPSLDRPVQLEDFGLDSLGHFSFLMMIEQELGFEYPEEKFTLANLGSLDGLVNVVCEQLSAEKAASTGATAGIGSGTAEGGGHIAA